jgi:hypothetical protein
MHLYVSKEGSSKVTELASRFYLQTVLEQKKEGRDTWGRSTEALTVHSDLQLVQLGLGGRPGLLALLHRPSASFTQRLEAPQRQREIESLGLVRAPSWGAIGVRFDLQRG